LKPSTQRYLFDASGSYRIRVQGHVAAEWSDTFCGMSISSRRGKGKSPTSVLSGTLIDQASLMGVLTTLYEMGYTLLDVKRLPEPPAGDPRNSEDPA
jgi:hypothetical protein